MDLRKITVTAAVICALAGLVILISCGGGGGNGMTGGTGGNGTVAVNLSDPPTCQAPAGPYSHVFVTVTDVEASTNANAGDNDPSFVDLTPSLKNNPVQIDLLGTASSQCFLAQLGAGASIPSGTYEQFRVILVSNSANTPITNNQCNGSFNCVVLASNGSVHTLLLSSEDKTGIKIPTSQIAQGGLTVPAGSTVTLNIDFNACESIVLQGNGQYRLKPVLHAGEVSVSASNSISGTVVDKATSAAVVGGTTIVALEQKDSNNIDRVIMETVAGSSGNFVFCPVAVGSYDVVVTAISGTGVQYAATVTTGVQPGTAMGNIPLIAQSAPTAPAILTGQVNTAGASGGAQADVTVSALQTAGGVMVTVPLAQQSTSVQIVATIAAGACPSGSDCGSYTLDVPAANPNVGAFVSGATSYSQAAGAVNYTVDGVAVQSGTPSTPDCFVSPATQSDVQVSAPNVVSGSNPAVPAMNLTNCT